VFFVQSAAGRQMTGGAGQEQLSGSGHSGMLQLQGRRRLERQRRHLVGDSLFDWQPVKVKVTNNKNIAGVGICILVSAGFFHFQTYIHRDHSVHGAN